LNGVIVKVYTYNEEEGKLYVETRPAGKIHRIIDG
jgi:hypothetical protein